MMVANDRDAFLALREEDISKACQGRLHERALDGLYLFNRREFWLAHEALEEAWLVEEGLLRHLYKGVLQAAVAYLHMLNGNFIGSLKMFERSHFWLAPWPDECAGICIGKLRADLSQAVEAVGKLGAARMNNFDKGLIRQIEFHT
jgi:predicted metal-dependent hydrolase